MAILSSLKFTVPNYVKSHQVSRFREAIIKIDQWSNGTMDRWTNGPMDLWTNRPIDQWTNGLMDQRYFQDIPKITPRYPQDIPKISQRYPQDIPNIPKISPRYPQHLVTSIAYIYTFQVT